MSTSSIRHPGLEPGSHFAMGDIFTMDNSVKNKNGTFDPKIKAHPGP
jgi:hypothetical protein